MPGFVDMHCHLGFLKQPAAFAQAAQECDLGFFSNTVTPDNYACTQKALDGVSCVRVGAGLHPWWVAKMDADELDHALGQLEKALECTRYLGEVGLDFGKRWEGSRDAQLRAFRRIAHACGEQGGKLLSVHAVRSASTVLDLLENAGCLESCDVVFHWYSDSGEALVRAIRAGCYFSVNPRMLATRRGREYARTIPTGQLLLETDLPPEDASDFEAGAWLDALADCARGVEELRGAVIRKKVLATSLRLLNWQEENFE